jgi:hypothetical protein
MIESYLYTYCKLSKIKAIMIDIVVTMTENTK